MIAEQCLSALVFNDKFFRSTLPYIKREYFETLEHQQVFDIIGEFYSDYLKQPNVESILLLLNNKKMREDVYDACIDTVSKLYDSQVDTEFLTKEVEGWCKDRAINLALNEAILIMDDSSTTHLSRSGIPELLREAITVSFDSDVGHSYRSKGEEMYDWYHDSETKIKFPMEIFNRITDGGYKRKTLNVVQAGINVGKTTFLVWLAAEAAKAGLNVLYFTLEIDDKTVHERLDTTMFSCSFSDLKQYTRDEYMKRVDKSRKAYTGEILIKEYPTDTANANHFRHIISEAKLKKNFTPDLIIIDYLTIACSSKLSNASRGNTDSYYTAVASELRALAQETGAPIWTASQLTRSGQKADNVDISDGGLSLGIAKTADFMMVIMQPEELASMNQAIVKVIKNRYADKNSFKKFKIILDNSTQTLKQIQNDAESIMLEEQAPKQHFSTNGKGGFVPKVKENVTSAWNM